MNKDKGFTLRAPRYTPEGDPTPEVTSTAPEGRDSTKPATKVLDVTDKNTNAYGDPRVAVSEEQDLVPSALVPEAAPERLEPVDLPPNEELPEPELEEGEKRFEPFFVTDPGYRSTEAQKHKLKVIPAVGSNSVAYGASVIRDYAISPRALVDPDMLGMLNTWFARYLELLVTVDVTIGDFAHAITDNGAKLDLDLGSLQKLLANMMHMRQLRELITNVGLADYESEILLAEIDREFGRARELEHERAGRVRREGAVADAVLDLRVIAEQLRDTAERTAKAAAESAARPSVYHQGPAQRAQAQPTPAPAAVPPAPIQESDA